MARWSAYITQRPVTVFLILLAVVAFSIVVFYPAR
jgi:hypothetical protein